jgi:hypothetical protein
MGELGVMADIDDSFEAGSDANREYKDSVFTLLFNDEKVLAEVYGAISGINFGADVKIKIATLKKVLAGGLFNDVALRLTDTRRLSIRFGRTRKQ